MKHELEAYDESRLRGRVMYWDSGERKCLDFAPFSSAEVERVFSIYKAMYRDNRKSFEFENFRKFVIAKSIFQKVSH